MEKLRKFTDTIRSAKSGSAKNTGGGGRADGDGDVADADMDAGDTENYHGQVGACFSRMHVIGRTLALSFECCYGQCLTVGCGDSSFTNLVNAFATANCFV
jgi:hypothetical protein